MTPRDQTRNPSHLLHSPCSPSLPLPKSEQCWPHRALGRYAGALGSMFFSICCSSCPLEGNAMQLSILHPQPTLLHVCVCMFPTHRHARVQAAAACCREVVHPSRCTTAAGAGVCTCALLPRRASFQTPSSLPCKLPWSECLCAVLQPSPGQHAPTSKGRCFKYAVWCYRSDARRTASNVKPSAV